MIAHIGLGFLISPPTKERARSFAAMPYGAIFGPFSFPLSAPPGRSAPPPAEAAQPPPKKKGKAKKGLGGASRGRRGLFFYFKKKIEQLAQRSLERWARLRLVSRQQMVAPRPSSRQPKKFLLVFFAFSFFFDFKRRGILGCASMVWSLVWAMVVPFPPLLHSRGTPGAPSSTKKCRPMEPNRFFRFEAGPTA